MRFFSVSRPSPLVSAATEAQTNFLSINLRRRVPTGAAHSAPSDEEKREKSKKEKIERCEWRGERRGKDPSGCRHSRRIMRRRTDPASAPRGTLVQETFRIAGGQVAARDFIVIFRPPPRKIHNIIFFLVSRP